MKATLAKRIGLALIASASLIVLRSASGVNPPILPNPVLYPIGQEFLSINGKRFTQYNFDVANKESYPAELFAAAPKLPSAIWDQDSKLAEFLRRHGGKLDCVFRDETPLLRTIKAKRFALLDWLVSNGADINFQDSSGYSALHYAASGTHTLAQIKEPAGSWCESDARGA